MPVYFAPGERCATRPASQIPALARILSAGPWACCDSNQCGAQGVMAWPAGTEQLPPGSGKDEDWITCGDGLRYLRGQPIAPQSALARDHKIEGIDYQTSRGVTLTIPLAMSSPRTFSFSTGKASGFAEDFARLAFKVFDRLRDEQSVHPLDPEVLKLVADAIGHVYRTTPEILDELGWITSADIDPILCCIWGSDPKASKPAGGTSPSSAGA